MPSQSFDFAEDQPFNVQIGFNLQNIIWFADCYKSILMSKLNVKFIYSGQIRNEVLQIQRGPIKLDNLYNSYLHPEYEQISFTNSSHIDSNQNIPSIATVQMNSKPTSPKDLLRARSVQTLHSINKAETNKPNPEGKRPILDLEEMKESEFKAIQKPKKPSHIDFSEAIAKNQQIVLKAPSYKLAPKTEGDISRSTKKEYLKSDKTQKYMYNGIPQKSEDDFIGCFGCMQKKPKAYSISNQNTN